MSGCKNSRRRPWPADLLPPSSALHPRLSQNPTPTVPRPMTAIPIHAGPSCPSAPWSWSACDWNEDALRVRFREGLDDKIQDEIVTHELPRDFNSLVELALRVEGCLQRRRRRWMARPSCPLGEGAPSSALTSSPSVPDPEPMQVGRLDLTAKQKQDRLSRGLCLYCGKPGHRAIRCPLKAKAHQ